jgi:uncharacterized membrane protein YagU involved in acid resistance
LGGGLTAGALDFTYANIFYYLWKQIPPIKIWQSVASGLIGKAAYDGGLATAALGTALHFSITIVMAAAFVLVNQRLTFLARQPLVFGVLYGVFLYYFMNGVVLPLSSFPTPPDMSHFPMVGKSIEPFIGGLLIHAFGVGLPIALFARRAAAE